MVDGGWWRVDVDGGRFEAVAVSAVPGVQVQGMGQDILAGMDGVYLQANQWLYRPSAAWLACGCFID